MRTIPINRLAIALAAFLPTLAHAQANLLLTQSVPALDEYGLIGLVAAVGVVAGWILKRRGK